MFSLLLRVSDKYRHLIVVFLAVLLAVSFAFIWGSRYRQTYLLFKVESFQQSSLQVFFDTGEGIGERFSQVREIPGATVRYLLRFPVPGKPIYSLRIDPSERMRIVEISLVDGRNALITSLDTDSLVALNDIDSIRKTDEGVLVIPKKGDPQLGLVLSTPLPNRYGFKILFACTLFFAFYTFFQLALFLPSRINKKKSVCVKGQAIARSRSWLYGFHLLALSLGWLAILGAVVLLVSEGRRSLGAGQRKHDLIAYRKDVISRSVSLQRSPDNLSLHGMLYEAKYPGESHSAVLLLHGNYPQGSDFPLYRVMATELAGRGYTVLTIDFAGYGRSADPFTAGILKSINLDIDAIAGVEFLQQQTGLCVDFLHIVGHSMGADPAISVGSMTKDVRSITLIGPPRRVYERFNWPPDVNFFWNWAQHVRKTVYGKEQFPDWFSKEIWRQQILDRDMVHSLDYFSRWNHKPVLFLDGERETGQDREFLQWYYCRTSWPKQYVTLSKADHNCNVVVRDGRIYYDPAVMGQAIEVMDLWFRRAEKTQPQFYDLVLNLLRHLFAVEMLKRC